MIKIEHKDRGWKITNGNKITYIGEYGQENANEGVIYKDYEAFRTGEGICYIPEYGFENKDDNFGKLFEFHAKQCEAAGIEDNSYQAETGYTRQDFIEMCDGDISLAEDIFQECDWQHPETLLDEYEQFCD